MKKIIVHLLKNKVRVTATKVGEMIDDANLFMELLFSLKSYELNKGELKFFDDEKKNYLLFKLIKQ
jgi:hypothetical protein